MAGGFAAFMGSPAGGAAIQGGFSVGGNLFSAREAKKANRRNVALYRENREWEERMANTEWQRGVADMLAAGINPMLAVQQGGASTPSVQAPEVMPEKKWSGVAESVAKNPAALLGLQQMQTNLDISKEKYQQEKMTTDVMRFNTHPEMMGDEWMYKIDLIKAQIKREQSAGALNEAQAKQIMEMLPVAIQLDNARRRLADEQSTSAAQTRRMEAYSEAELKATERWFEEMGASPKVIEFMKQAISILGRK